MAAIAESGFERGGYPGGHPYLYGLYGAFPESPEYYFYLGIAYYQQQKYQEALNTYYAGLNIIPKENLPLKSDFYGQIGDIYYQMGQLDQAYKAYDEALKYNDKNVVVLNNYSYFLSLEKKRLEEGGAYERPMYQAGTGQRHVSGYLRLDLLRTKETIPWRKSISRALWRKIRQRAPNSWIIMGTSFFMNGDKEKAVEQWKKAKEMGKDSEILNRKIAEQQYIEDENAFK